MALVVTVKPSNALDKLKVSQYVESEYNSESGSTELQNDVESAYGSECGSNLELQNSVVEIQENVENNTQKLEYFEKSDGILRNLFTEVKNENVLMKKQNEAINNKCAALQNKYDASGSQHFS